MMVTLAGNCCDKIAVTYILLKNTMKDGKNQARRHLHLFTTNYATMNDYINVDCIWQCGTTNAALANKYTCLCMT